MGHGFRWTTTSGNWGAAANWLDQTTGQSGLLAPGVADSAIIQGGLAGSEYLLTGPGIANSVGIDGSIALSGTFSLGTMLVGDGNGANGAAMLDLLPGATLAATSLTVDQLRLDGAGAMVTAGGLVAGLLSLRDGSSLRADNATISGSFTLAPTATLEIGEAGVATPGTIAIDAGATLIARASLAVPILDNGLLDISSGATIGPVSGTGTVLVANNTLAGPIGAGITVRMVAANAILTLPANGLAAPISGFAPGSRINVGRTDIFASSYSSDPSGGTLSLLGAGGATLDTLQFVGGFDGMQFVIMPDGAQTEVFVVAAQPNFISPGQSSFSFYPGGPGIISGGGTVSDLNLGGASLLQGTYVAGSANLQGTTMLTDGATLDVGTMQFITGTPGEYWPNQGMFVWGAGAVADIAGLLVYNGGTVAALDGGFVRAGSVTFNNNGASRPLWLEVDATGTIEIGTTGTTLAAGALTIQPNGTLSVEAGVSGTIEANLVNLGTIADAGSLTVIGTISGDGTIAFSHLAIAGNVLDGQTLSFNPGGTLDLTAAGQVAGSIANFTAGDAILVDPATTALVYTRTGPRAGQITLEAGAGAVVGVFGVTPLQPGYGYVLTPSAGDGPASIGIGPRAGTPGSAQFDWNGGSGAWSALANWNDVLAGQNPALRLPGTFDEVAITAQAFPGFLVISGNGGADAVTLTDVAGSLGGGVALSGQFTFGAVIGTGSDTLDLLAGSVLTTETVSLGVLTLAGATIDGFASLSVGSILTVSNGGFVQALALSATPTINVSPTATLELGTAGGAMAGAFNIDAGYSYTLAPGATLAANLVVNGTLTLPDRTVIARPIQGSGTVVLAGSATLDGPVSAGMSVQLATSGTLTLGAGGFAGTLANLSRSDSLFIANPAITATSYGGTTAGGTLDLLGAGGATLGAVTLSGNFLGDTFLVRPDGNGVLVSLALNAIPAQTAAPAGTPAGHSFVWALPLGGGWATTANWNDATTGQPATVAPGSHDTIRLASPIAGAVAIFGGDGNAAAATVSGDTALSGTFSFGSLAPLGTADRIALLPGSTLSAASAGGTGALLVDGASFIDTGTAGIASLALVGGAMARAAGWNLLAGGAAPASNTISLDAASSFEIGGSGHAVPGSVVIDAGATLTAFGATMIGNAIRNQGVIVATPQTVGSGPGAYYVNSVTIDGPVTGSGTIIVQGNAGLGAGDIIVHGLLSGGQTIAFAGSGATLDVSASGATGITLAGAVDAATLAVPAGVVAVAYAGGGATGTLALLDQAGTTLDTLTVPAPDSGSFYVAYPSPRGGPTLIRQSASSALPTVSNGVAYIGYGAVNHVGAGTALVVSGAGSVFNTPSLVEYDSPPTSTMVDAGNGASVVIGAASGFAGQSFAVEPGGRMEIGNAGTGATGVLTVDAGMVFSAGTLYAAVVNNGTITGANLIAGDLVNNGALLSTGSVDGAISGVGMLPLAAGIPLLVSGTIGAGQTVDFLNPFSAIAFTASANGPTIRNFTTGDVIAIRGTPVDSASFAQTAPDAGVLSLSSDGMIVARLDLAGDYANRVFLANPDRVGGTDIVLADGVTVACFAEGTRIRTQRGEVAVEALRAGDRVISAFGGSAPVIWLGHRQIDIARHRRPQDVRPVRVHAHAFGPGLPARDLRLSPDHAVVVDGALIPVRYLVNGATIVQEPAARVTYWHIELPAHDVILAEGLPCESYLDTGNRTAFANGGPAIEAHPDFARRIWDSEGCAPLVLGGARLAAARRRLLQAAAALGRRLTDDPALRVVADRPGGAVRQYGAAIHVALPGGASTLRIGSRTWIPEQTRPGETDARRLGVAIADIHLDGRRLDLRSPRLVSGWHDAEDAWRWTAGDALLDATGARDVRFRIAMRGTYWAPVVGKASLPARRA